MSGKTITQMTKLELIDLVKRQAQQIQTLQAHSQDLESQLQIRTAAVIIDQDSSHLVNVLRERIKTLEQQLQELT